MQRLEVAEISPSALYLWKQCPFKFYLHYRRYPKLPAHPDYRDVLDFGSIVHEVIAEYYRNIPKSITPDGAKTLLAEIFNKKWPSNLAHLRTRAEDQLLNFLRFEKRRLSWGINPRPIAVEEEFRKPPLHGIVDALFKAPNGELIVVDWKTGRGVRLTPEIVFQMNVYLYLTSASRAYVVFLETGDWYEVKYTVDVRSIANELISSSSYPRRPGKWCSTCEYQLSCFHLSGRIRRWDPWSGI